MPASRRKESLPARIHPSIPSPSGTQPRRPDTAHTAINSVTMVAHLSRITRILRTIRLPVETETIGHRNSFLRRKIIPCNRTTIGHCHQRIQSGSRSWTTRSPSRRNARRHRPVTIHRRHQITTTELTLHERRSNNHRERRTTTRVIPMLRWPYPLPTRVNPAHPKPAATTHQPPRPTNARNTTSPHLRRHRNQNRRVKIRTKPVTATVQAMVRVMVRVMVQATARDINWRWFC